MGSFLTAKYEEQPITYFLARRRGDGAVYRKLISMVQDRLAVAAALPWILRTYLFRLYHSMLNLICGQTATKAVQILSTGR